LLRAGPGVQGTPLEREIEDALIANITKLLAEMGGYFTFAGRQVAIKVSENEYFIDLLFSIAN
jgi:predicted nuclease of restriction endonuclease-like (RecB) superfamily